MSGQQYTRKIESTRKALNALKKDIQYREEQVLRNETTYTLDAEINGQFLSINEDISTLRMMYQNFQKKAKQLNIMQRELDKRRQALEFNVQEKNKLKRMYDEAFAKKIPNTRAAKEAENVAKFEKVYNKDKNMSKEQLLALKQKQQKQQDEVIDDLLGAVKAMKNGQGQIRKQLEQQDGLLDELQAGMDDNIENMSKVKRNMMKLMESSSYWCLILVILIEVAGIICNLLLWPKTN